MNLPTSSSISKLACLWSLGSGASVMELRIRTGKKERITPSPPSVGGEGRGEVERFPRTAPLLFPLPTPAPAPCLGSGSRGEEQETRLDSIVARSRARGLAFLLLSSVIWSATGPSATAQLAITEAFPSAAEPPPDSMSPNITDFWELTNFGDQPISLTGYKWNDSTGGLAEADPAPFVGLWIDPGESIVFVELDPVTMYAPEQFVTCWPGLSAVDTQIVFYDGTGNGLNSRGDGIRLWGRGAVAEDVLVDSVDFGEASAGRSFISEPVTGRFGYVSVEGEDGAFRSDCGDNIASPGTATNVVALMILRQPQDLEICPGLDAEFSIEAIGLPRPKFQWYRNGDALSGARGSTLVIPNAQPNDAGTYQVRLNNGIDEEVTSVEVTLSVMADLMMPTPLVPLRDESCLVGETAKFTAYICANPPAHYQWFKEGVAVAGGTNRTLTIPDCPLDPVGARYCVVASNELGRLELCAMLFVNPIPELEFTEVMACSSPLCLNYGDWFELTNVGTNTVDLAGYRFASVNGRFPSLVGL